MEKDQRPYGTMDTVIDRRPPAAVDTVPPGTGRIAGIDVKLRSFLEENLLKQELNAGELEWLNTTDPGEVRPPEEGRAGVGNLARINNVRRINKFLEKTNRELRDGHRLVICAETKTSRKERILNKYPAVISRPYYLLDFILKRVFPKWKPTLKLYFRLTGGRNRVLSKAEVLGRLYSCGFCVHRTAKYGHLTWFYAEKTDEPAYDMAPTYGALVTLNRIGRGGKMIKVYKLRTMHPYSEYIQNYVYENNHLDAGGKFKNDFRVTGWGRIFRRYWIDELPMLINWLRREMKIVGVRPLSRHYFDLYPEDMKNLRVQMKPGLIPPFYADLPETLEEIIESERAYIHAYREKPLRTDLRYFCKAIYNIVLGRARSN